MKHLIGEDREECTHRHTQGSHAECQDNETLHGARLADECDALFQAVQHAASGLLG